MIKGIILAVAFLFSMSAFSCAKALPTNDVNFCSSFKSVAICHCTQSGLPAGMCQDMNALYKRLVSVFGSLQRACEFQKHTTTQDCLDNWNCYRLGGIDSQGRLCSATQLPCS